MPDVSAIATAPGESNSGSVQDASHRYMPGIEGLSNEDKVPDEGSVFYDIRFYALLPAGRQRIRIIMNVEAQRSFYPGYEIVTRGIYYAARMLSAQLGTEFVEPDYDNIKKVYSIWLCMNAPRYIGNAISVYHLTKEELESGIPDKPQAYDKLTVCIVTLNEHQPAENELLKMLNTLLSPELGYEEKTRTLAEKFGLPLKRKSGEELNLMCNLSEYVYEKGIEKGIKQGINQGMEQGIEQGIKQGAESARRELLKNMKKEGYTDEAILKIFQMTPEKLSELKNGCMAMFTGLIVNDK